MRELDVFSAGVGEMLGCFTPAAIVLVATFLVEAGCGWAGYMPPKVFYGKSRDEIAIEAVEAHYHCTAIECREREFWCTEDGVLKEELRKTRNRK